MAMTREQFDALPEAPMLKAARILPSEVCLIPELGLTISVDAMWKLGELAPDPEGAADYLARMKVAVNKHFADLKKDGQS
jgi:hypothetical protein